MTDVDPVKFGQLIGQVKTLEAQVEDLQKDVKELLALENMIKLYDIVSVRDFGAKGDGVTDDSAASIVLLRAVTNQPLSSK